MEEKKREEMKNDDDDKEDKLCKNFMMILFNLPAKIVIYILMI
jgi:hypothetical protein